MLKNYQIQIIVVGIMPLCFGLYELPSLVTRKSSLIPMQGTIRFANTYVIKVVDWKGHNSRNSKLIFSLNEYEQRYCFSENIGMKYRDDNHEKMVKQLRQADSVRVWIKKSEILSSSPEVFQIEGDDGLIILRIEETKRKKLQVTSILLLFGLIYIIIFLWQRYRAIMNKYFGVTNNSISS